MSKTPDNFPDWIAAYLKDHDCSLSDLTKRMGVSLPLASQYRTGITKPSRVNALAIADKLELDGGERVDFLRCILGGSFLENEVEVLKEDLSRLVRVEQGSTSHLPELFRILRGEITKWKHTRHVTTAIVPTGGWQKEVLNPETTGKLLACVRREAIDAGLRRIIIVAAPGQDQEIKQVWPDEMDRYGDVKVRVQDYNAPGLGEAILCGARSLYDGEAFALMMPDEFPVQPVMKRLLEQHEQTQDCVFALFGNRDLKHQRHQRHSIARGKMGPHGMARIEKLIDERDADKETRGAHENDGGAAQPGALIRRHVFGRYVLTYDFIEALKNKRTELRPLRESARRAGRTGLSENYALGFTTVLDELLRDRKDKAAGGSTQPGQGFSGFVLPEDDEPKIIPADLRRQLLEEVESMVEWCGERYPS